MILTKDEVKEKRDRHILVQRDDLGPGFIEHCRKYDFHRVSTPETIGQHFLYESVSYSSDGVKITYPSVGVFTNLYVIDQAIEVEWINCRRTWEYSVEYEYEYNGKIFTSFACDDRTELKYTILWSDSMLVYGVWDTKPNWKQLKECYNKTWMYKRSVAELRDIRLNNLLD